MEPVPRPTVVAVGDQLGGGFRGGCASRGRRRRRARDGIESDRCLECGPGMAATRQSRDRRGEKTAAQKSTLGTAKKPRAGAPSGEAPRRTLCGGIDLGGTKIQAAIVDAKGKVSGDARSQTPVNGGPEDVAKAMAAALEEAASKAGVEPSGLLGVGVGSPGTVDAEDGRGLERQQPPRLGRHLSARRAPLGRARHARSASATTSRSRPTPSSSSARRASSTPCSASSGAPASAAGSCSTASRGWAAAPRARSATW